MKALVRLTKKRKKETTHCVIMIPNFYSCYVIFGVIQILDMAYAVQMERPPTDILSSSIAARCCRRSFLVSAFCSVAGISSSSDSAQAACLPGDESPECIGVYKVQMEEDFSSKMNKATLKAYAPDIKYVPPPEKPKSVKKALEMLEQQRSTIEQVRESVAAGRLEEAGVLVLRLSPKLISAGKVLVESVGEVIDPSKPGDQLRLSRAQSAFELLQGLWGSVDVMIGQGIRGDMGVSAAAQIQILSELREASAAYDDFLAEFRR